MISIQGLMHVPVYRITLDVAFAPIALEPGQSMVEIRGLTHIFFRSNLWRSMYRSYTNLPMQS